VNCRGWCGSFPRAIMQARSGDFYMSTLAAILKTTAAGTTVAHVLDHTTEGGAPSRLFYGATGNGGSADVGTIFRVTPAGAFDVLHTFSSGRLRQRPDCVRRGVRKAYVAVHLQGTDRVAVVRLARLGRRRDTVMERSDTGGVAGYFVRYPGRAIPASGNRGAGDAARRDGLCLQRCRDHRDWPLIGRLC
jgi:uncharacterized repeat protein (TIGR03803 family)